MSIIFPKPYWGHEQPVGSSAPLDGCTHIIMCLSVLNIAWGCSFMNWAFGHHGCLNSGFTAESLVPLAGGSLWCENVC